MTLAKLVEKYGSEGRAAGAVALQIEPTTSLDWTWWPEPFRSLVLFKQHQAILRLAAIGAGTSLTRLQEQWHMQDAVDAATEGTEGTT